MSFGKPLGALWTTGRASRQGAWVLKATHQFQTRMHFRKMGYSVEGALVDMQSRERRPAEKWWQSSKEEIMKAGTKTAQSKWRGETRVMNPGWSTQKRVPVWIWGLVVMTSSWELFREKRRFRVKWGKWAQLGILSVGLCVDRPVSRGDQH